ncbi:MAG: translation elongation factor-like protein [Chloroflexi bacterium]|nr:translation elongation factor-like protein [Chloroflexota bacterium]
MEEELQYVGVVTRFFTRISVAVVMLEDELYLDDWVLIYGPQTNVEQQVTSIQVNHQAIDKGEPGEEIAIKVDELVREGDEVYLILAEA